jgi:HTH-type transcriptional regulator/antitoxin HigA
MIRNQRQLEIARKKLAALEQSARHATPEERVTYAELIADLRHAVQEYRAIEQRSISLFQVRSVDDLPDALIKARIYRGWTHRQLADELGVTEQMVQKDESGGYESAALYRLAEIADALDFSLQGTLMPTENTTIHSETVTTSVDADFHGEFVSPSQSESQVIRLNVWG